MTSYNTCKLAHIGYMYQVTLGDIMGKELTQERFCVDSAVRAFYIYKDIWNPEIAYSFTQPKQFILSHSLMSQISGHQ